MPTTQPLLGSQASDERSTAAIAAMEPGDSPHAITFPLDPIFDVDEATLVALPAKGIEQSSAQAGRFSVGRALKYSAASLGAQAVFTLFNMGMPLYLEGYSTSPWLIGLLANERSLVGAVIQPIVGRLSDRTHTRFGRRRPFFLVGAPLTCLSLLALGLHPPFWVMLGVMSVAAFFLSIAMDPYLAMMADLFPAGQRGRVGGFAGMASALGTVVFLLFAALFWEHAEFTVFALVALVLAACFAVTFFTLKEPVRARTPIPNSHLVDNPGVISRVRMALPSLKEHREARKYIAAVLLFWGGGGGVAPFITLFAKHALGANEGSAFLLPVGYVISSLIFVLPAGYLADHIGKKRVLTIGLGLYALGALLGSQATAIEQGVGAMALLGIASACTSVLIPLLTDLVPAEKYAEVVGIASALWSFAQPVGSVVAGLVVNATSASLGLGTAYRLVFLLAGVMIVASVIMLQRVRPENAARHMNAA